MTPVETLLQWLIKNHYYINNDLLKKVEKLKQMEKLKKHSEYMRGWYNGFNSKEIETNNMEKTAVDFYNQEIKELFNQFQGEEISVNMFHVLRLTALTRAKEMEKQEKLKIQIAENESVLEMLRLHGNDSSIIRVFSRLESLKEQLKELPFKSN